VNLDSSVMYHSNRSRSTTVYEQLQRQKCSLLFLIKHRNSKKLFKKETEMETNRQLMMIDKLNIYAKKYENNKDNL
jgi:hypothetical protein